MTTPDVNELIITADVFKNRLTVYEQMEVVCVLTKYVEDHNLDYVDGKLHETVNKMIAEDEFPLTLKIRFYDTDD